MWLKIVFDEGNYSQWNNEPFNITVSIETDLVAPIEQGPRSFRISPIFPLLDKIKSVPIKDIDIYFFNFSNAYRVLGRIKSTGSPELKASIFFSAGLSSIILLTSTEETFSEFKELLKYTEDGFEKWTIKDSKIKNVSCFLNEEFKKSQEFENIFQTIDYSRLSITERALIDEFYVSVRMLLLKLTTHMLSELPKIKRLIDEINIFVYELVFLTDFEGNIPENLSEFTLDELKNPKINNEIRQQNIDRIIQVNSALSYVSTQAFSGAIPILERRSLIRRNSLLGVGSAILALNNIARFIEDCFAQVAFAEGIIKGMTIAAPLDGLDDLLEYDAEKWRDEASINTIAKHYESSDPYYKLPYFNGRLGFRETEYSIAAAIQCITSGVTLEWSLMTITHEMLHGHVRTIIDSIFFGDDNINSDQQRIFFYEDFKKAFTKVEKDRNLISSLRRIIFTYCCSTIDFGSIATKPNKTDAEFDIYLPERDVLWNIFERENRNISEIFVHVLDLHYFYGSRVYVYIPLIWSSWVAIPYINGDLRQYILRSLLTIASKETGSVYERFNKSKAKMSELLTKYKDTKLNHPIIHDVIDILSKNDILMDYYFPSFKGSLIIVDVAMKIFLSAHVRGLIFKDDFAKWENAEKTEGSFEEEFKYELPDGFNDEIVESPVSYLLANMSKGLSSNISDIDVERETTIQFLALNSNR
jgi:hypothetical protein